MIRPYFKACPWNFTRFQDFSGFRYKCGYSRAAAGCVCGTTDMEGGMVSGVAGIGVVGCDVGGKSLLMHFQHESLMVGKLEPGLDKTQFFLFPFCKKSLICKSMTPHRGNTILLRSSQQLPRLPLEPSTRLVRCFRNYRDTRTPSGVPC